MRGFKLLTQTKGLWLLVVVCWPLFANTTVGKEAAVHDFVESQYNLTNTKIAKPAFKFADLNICIIEVENEVGDAAENKVAKSTNGLYQFERRAWLTVEKHGRTLSRIYFDRISGLGGSAGLYVPSPQPISKYFLVLMMGNYDDRLLIIDKSGKITNVIGSNYFITTDRHYLVSYPNDACEPGLAVFNLDKGCLAFSREHEEGEKRLTYVPNIEQWYRDTAGYFFTSDEKHKWIYVYSFRDSKLNREPARNRITKALKVRLDFDGLEDHDNIAILPQCEPQQAQKK